MSNMQSKTLVPADILVDDKRENLLEWAADGRTAIRFSRPWNNGFGYEGTGIIPARDWKEVVEIVRERA
jgi:5'(3')-deoxyribonucleotidase